MESKIMACKKCTEELGVYATSFQHGCYECWKLLQETIKAKDATIAELESRLEQSVDIGVVNELNETIEKQKKEINKAVHIIQGILGLGGIATRLAVELKAKTWLENNK